MSTRSLIGLEQEDGSILAIYCHSDGYPDGPHGVGFKLEQHYTDLATIRALIDLGDLSCLGKEVGERVGFGAQGDVTIAYGRDRGDKGTEAAKCVNRAEFFMTARGCNAAWTYLYNGRAWETTQR